MEDQNRLNPRAVTPNFEEDIFISYDHDDNATPLPTFKGWVDTMHESLLARLTQLIGEKPAIWRDTKLSGVDQFPEIIAVRLAKTAFLLSVMSPSFVKSEWCKKELHKFYERAAATCGIKINNKSRIFKVVKTPVCRDPNVDPLKDSDLPLELRTVLQESLGYHFYEINKLDGKLREFWPEMGPELLTKFLQKLEDLAQDIKAFIESQQNAASEQVAKTNIYLAETTPELSEERDDIKRMLQLNGYHVVPDENLPFESAAFEERVKGYLENSVLSIHLIGSDHTLVPAEDELRANLNLEHQFGAMRVSKQHELAMDRGEDDESFSRLLWLPEGLSAKEPSYRQFLAVLDNDPSVYERADILTGIKLEDLKTIIKRKLKNNAEVRTDEVHPTRIYLYCDKHDLPAIAPLRHYLETEKGMEVLLPFDNETQISRPHSENLRLCDALVIYFGDSETINHKLKFLRKSTGRPKPILAKAIYIGGPETELKAKFQTNDAFVIRNFGEFEPDSFNQFFAQIDRALGT